MSKIKIGADELILWLRKNNHAAGVANDILGKGYVNLLAKGLNLRMKIFLFVGVLKIS